MFVFERLCPQMKRLMAYVNTYMVKKRTTKTRMTQRIHKETTLGLVPAESVIRVLADDQGVRPVI